MGPKENDKKFWKNVYPFIANLLQRFYLNGKKEGKINGTLFSHVTKISINVSIFEIFPSNFLCVIPIGVTKDLCKLKLL